MKPCRGDIWLVNLDPTQGREQAGRRPALVVSVDLFNHGPADLIVVVPLTTKNKHIPLHVELAPTESGLAEWSYAKCEDIRSISVNRLAKKIGIASNQAMMLVEDRLRILLAL